MTLESAVSAEDYVAPTPASARTVRKPRCRVCGRILAWYVTPPWSIQCSRSGCGATNGG